MSLGILNNIAAIYAENSLNQTQASLQTVLQQLSSGSRINSGADDAAGLSVVNGLKANEAALTQSSQNATNGIGLLQTADGALAQVTSLLTRAVTLATESANSTLNPTQVSSANAEYQTILAEIGDIGSTTNFSGNQVFTQTQTNLFVSDGSATGANSYNDTVGILTTASVGQTASTTTPVTSALTPAAGTTASAVTQASSLQAFDSLAHYNLANNITSGSITIALGTGTAVTISSATATSGAALLTAINSNTTLQSEGISATVNGSGVINIVGPANGQGGSLSVTNTFGVTTGTFAASTQTPAVSGQGTETLTLGSATSVVGGTLTIQVGSGTATTVTVNAGTTGTALVNLLNSNSTLQLDGVTAGLSGNVITLTGPSGAANGLTVSAVLTQTTVPSAAGGVNFQSSSINTLTSTTAPAVLTSLVSAIADVSYQRGLLGANINQLTAAANVANTAEVNLTSASNSIEATNYGQATSDLAKYEVLSQTGISALAQANTVQQEILKLLQ